MLKHFQGMFQHLKRKPRSEALGARSCSGKRGLSVPIAIGSEGNPKSYHHPLEELNELISFVI